MDRRTFTLGGLAGLAATGMPQWASATATKSLLEQFRAIPKAVWVFRQSTSADTLNVLAKQCRDIGIQSIWISFGAELTATLQNHRHPAWRTIRDLYASGYDLHALTGEASWCTRSKEMPKSIQNIVALPGFSKYFSHLHLDIEPHTLSDWKDAKKVDKLVDGYIDLFKTIRKNVPGQIKIDADITHHYPKFKGSDKTRDMIDRLSDHIDSLSLMTYSRPYQKALKLAEPVIKKGIPWRLGIHCEDFEGSDVSYADNGRDQFMSAMIECYNDIKSRPSSGFKGLAFYEMSGLRKILKLA